MSNKVNNVPQHKTIPATPATPDTGFGKIYIKADRLWYGLDDLGVETPLSGGGGGGISLTDLSAVSPLTYNNLTGSIGINQSSGSTAGYLSSTDWNTFNNKVSQINGMENFVTKFTSNSSLITASHIYDNGTCLAIGYGPTTVSSHKFSVNGQGSNTSTGGYFINDNALADSTGYGLVGASIKTTGTNIGVSGRAITGNTGTNIGIIGTAEGGSSNYAIQLVDGTQAIAGRFLKNIVDGKANWANITAADVSGVQGSLTLTTTGSSGAATLVGNTLNIPQYSGGGSGGFTWPAHIEYDETDKTLWVNGKNDGSTNTGFGQSTLKSTVSAYDNTALGANALMNLTSGYRNTAVGHNALLSATTCFLATAIGHSALKNYTAGAKVVAIGQAAMQNATTASDTVAVGFGALGQTLTSGNNTAVGENAMHYTTTGSYNVAVGSGALVSNTTGSYNIAIGLNGLGGSNTGDNNVAIGGFTMAYNTTGANNVAVGHMALNKNTSAIYNVAIGESALTALTTGSRNTAVGRDSAYKNITGTDNLCLGYHAGFNMTGSGNVIIGSITDTDPGVSNSIVIGHQAKSYSSNEFVVGSFFSQAGAITTESVTANATWSVRINDQVCKILIYK